MVAFPDVAVAAVAGHRSSACCHASSLQSSSVAAAESAVADQAVVQVVAALEVGYLDREEVRMTPRATAGLA